MAVPLARNAFAEKRPDLFGVFSKRSENVLFSFFLYKTTKRYSFRKIFAVLSIILRLQKKGTEFLGNDHPHDHYCYYHHHHHRDCCNAMNSCIYNIKVNIFYTCFFCVLFSWQLLKPRII